MLSIPPFSFSLASILADHNFLPTTGSIVFLLFSLTAIATILYLPHHLMFLVGRAWFYIHGDSALEVARETARTLVHTTAKTAAGVLGTETARAVVRAEL